MTDTSDPNWEAQILRDPNVTMDEVLVILTKVPLWLDIFVMENPAFDLICLENPLWERQLKHSVYHMARQVAVYRDPKCAQIVARGTLHMKINYTTAQKLLEQFVEPLLGSNASRRWVETREHENRLALVKMISDGATPKELLDFVGHQVK